MNRTPRLLRALVCALFAAIISAIASAAAPKVEETLVGPANAGGVYVVSPSGGRIAYMGMKGTRMVVTVDGVEGPVFDELFGPNGQSFYHPDQVAVHPAVSGGQMPGAMAPVIFTPDGAHYAYSGRQGNECVVIHDGKEVARLPRERFSLNYGTLTLSPGGRFVTFMEIERAGAGAKWRLNFNGKPGPWSSNNNGMNPVFSRDDTRYAYHAASENDPNKTVLIVDGKDAGYQGHSPVFTADGKSLLSISPATAASPKPSILVDGKPAVTPLSVDKIIPAPVGRRWGAIVRTKLEGYTQVPAFFLDGKEVPGTEGAKNAWFSKDGQHYAVVCENTAARALFMVIDGKKQPEYQSVTADEKTFWWTSDGSKFIYTVASGGRPFLIVNGEEIPITSLIGHDKIALAASGNRYGYGTRDGSNRNHSLVIDGKNVLPTGLRPYDNTLVFSPDGSRYGFFAGPAMRNEMNTLVLDGVVQEGMTPAYFANWVSNALFAPSFAFSPDGSHVAYMARMSNGRNNGIFMDGKSVSAEARAVYFPTFTSDSQHFFWVAEELSKVPGQGALTVVYVDGVEAVRANGRLFWPVPGTFTVDPQGVATFFAADGQAAKRYRITPSADTSVATLLEGGAQPATAAVTVAAPATTATTTTRTAIARPATAATVVEPVASVPVVALTWNDLVRRPETRPTTCTVNKDYRFQSGASVRAGAKVNVMEVTAVGLGVSTLDGRINFEVKAAETDVLDVANAAWAQLTPAQRELTYPALLQRMELWPYRVKLQVSYTIEGQNTLVGDAALFLSVEGGQLLVQHERTKFLFNVEAAETDLMAQARGFLASDTGAPGRVLEELAGKLVSPLTGRPAALAVNSQPKYVVLYRGAGWCGPCHVFSPELVKLLKDQAVQPEDAALIYVSADNNAAEAKAYVTKIGFDWPTIYYKSTDQLPAFHALFGTSIPQLVVTDRHGKVVVDSAKVGQQRALQQLAGLL